MRLIAAVDKNWAIGKNGRLLVSIPEDMRLFQAETAGKTVIMGRKTMESLKGRGPLAGRTNIVLTRNQNYHASGAVICHSIEEACMEASKYSSDNVYVIGGGMVYRQMLKFCDVADITKIDYAYDADVYFPNLDESAEWIQAAASGEKTYFDMVYEFVRYVRK